VLDQSGALLTRSGDAGQNAGLDAQQLQYVNQIESGYAKRIYELLEPIVGHDNLRATVAAEIDFSQTEATSEEFKPNQGADASVSVRSQQTTEQSGSAGALPSGVPGAASNQPPIAATAPLVGASQPLQAAPMVGGGTSGRREAVTNYEIDKTVRVTRNASGTVKRLNAAVVVNNRASVDAKGKPIQVALGTEELDKLTALVRESIGFRAERGDSVKVINAPFRTETLPSVQVPWWKEPEAQELMRGVALPGALAVVGLLVFFGLVRPGLKAVLTVPHALPGARLHAVEDERAALPTPATLPPPRPNEHLDHAKLMARQNPAAVAGILRSWVGSPGDVAPGR